MTNLVLTSTKRTRQKISNENWRSTDIKALVLVGYTVVLAGNLKLKCDISFTYRLQLPFSKEQQRSQQWMTKKYFSKNFCIKIELQQFVADPARNHNILDVFLSNNHSKVDVTIHQAPVVTSYAMATFTVLCNFLSSTCMVVISGPEERKHNS